MTKPDKSKLSYLEGLRGLAALQVVVVHFIYHMKTVYKLVTFYQPQNFAVAIFYILSGRILTLNAMKRSDFKAISSSMVRRPFRLALPVIGVILFNWILFNSGLLHKNAKKEDFMNSFYDLVINPLYLICSKGPLKLPIPGTSWTLSDEFQGSLGVYLVTMILFSFPVGGRARWIIMGTCFGWTLLLHKWIAHFFAGLMLAEMDVSGFLTRHSNWKWSLSFNLFLSLAVGFTFMESSFSFGRVTFEFLRSLQINGDGNFGVDVAFWQENISVLIISFTILFVVETTEFLQKIFSSPFPVYMGRISFSMYLFHPIIISSLSNQLIDMNPSEGLNPNVTICFIVLFFVSEVLTVFVDHPSVDFGRWVEKRLLGQWTSQELIITIPYWPRATISFLFGRFKVCILNFMSLSPMNAFPRFRRSRKWVKAYTIEEPVILEKGENEMQKTKCESDKKLLPI